MEFDIVKFPSAFSKSIGFTLCGIVDEPTSHQPLIVLNILLKYTTNNLLIDLGERY